MQPNHGQASDNAIDVEFGGTDAAKAEADCNADMNGNSTKQGYYGNVQLIGGLVEGVK